jgi:uncharacterized membrane protein YphA (DoxX/SURF4 family)
MKKLLFSAAPLPTRAIDAAWLLFRLHLGLSIADGAGRPKLVSLVASAGSHLLGPPDWFVQQVGSLGFTFPSPYFWAALAVWGELVGGLLLALGLFARWSALQLAFQFFVVAFIWYQEPLPLLGMYYQQLLFWAFVAVAAVGPGRYSLDYWLTRHRSLQGIDAPRAAAGRPAAVGAVLGGLLLATTCWAGGIRSDLLIEPGKQFVLGGGQRGAFKVVAHNKGKVAVEFRERPRGGGIFGKATLAPGKRATLSFLPGSAALLLNPSAQTANLDLRVSGDTGALRMNYEPNGQP